MRSEQPDGCPELYNWAVETGLKFGRDYEYLTEVIISKVRKGF
jgi:hypothetical protein